MEKERTYNYETKCRRCGSFHDWFFCQVKQMSWKDFMVAIIDYIKEPRSHHCEQCGKKTVQDVVSYSEPEGDIYVSKKEKLQQRYERHLIYKPIQSLQSVAEYNANMQFWQMEKEHIEKLIKTAHGQQ